MANNTKLQSIVLSSPLLTLEYPSDIILFRTFFVGSHTGLGLGNTIQLDSVEIEICVTGKNQITLSGYEA